jgi:cytochrome c biogenesis factor
MNDFFLNSYYILWTSFWYLPTFLVISFSVLLINLSKNGFGYIWLVAGISLVVISLHYQNLNVYNYLTDNCGSNFNTLLSNSVNKFHPALFYITLLHPLITLQMLSLNKCQKYVVNQGLLHSVLISNVLTPIVIFTLFLGSWWALQEGSWGGWWNWDPSEVFGLSVMLYYLYVLHKVQKPNNYPVLTFYLKILTQLIFITYVFIQLNFDLVSHNFGTRVDQFIDTSQNFLFIISLMLLLFTMTTYRLIGTLVKTLITSLYLINRKSSHTLVWYALITLIVLFILLSSFSLLLNDFLWKLLSVNIFNSTKFTYFYTSLLITSILIRSWNTQTHVILSFLYLIYFSKEVLVLLLIPIISTNNLLHTTLITILFVMLSESNQSTSLWGVLHESISHVQAYLVYDVGLPYVSLNNFMTEYSFNILSNSKASESVWNFSWTASSNEGHSFLHVITPDVLIQSLHSGNGLSSYMISVIDFSISTTNSTTVIILIFIYYVLSTRKLITF